MKILSLFLVNEKEIGKIHFNFIFKQILFLSNFFKIVLLEALEAATKQQQIISNVRFSVVQKIILIGLDANIIQFSS